MQLIICGWKPPEKGGKMKNIQLSSTTDPRFIVSSDQSATIDDQENPNFSIGNLNPYRVVEKSSIGFKDASQENENQEQPVDTEVQEAISRYNYSMFS